MGAGVAVGGASADLDLPWLGLLGNRDPQGEDAVGVHDGVLVSVRVHRHHSRSSGGAEHGLGEAFSISYRIVGADQVERRVVLVGEGSAGKAGEAAVLQGYYIDLTSDFESEAEQVASAAVQEAAKSRATIAAERAVAPTDLQVALDALLHDLSNAVPATDGAGLAGSTPLH